MLSRIASINARRVLGPYVPLPLNQHATFVTPTRATWRDFTSADPDPMTNDLHGPESHVHHVETAGRLDVPTESPKLRRVVWAQHLHKYTEWTVVPEKIWPLARVRWLRSALQRFTLDELLEWAEFCTGRATTGGAHGPDFNMSKFQARWLLRIVKNEGSAFEAIKKDTFRALWKFERNQSKMIAAGGSVRDRAKAEKPLGSSTEACSKLVEDTSSR